MAAQATQPRPAPPFGGAPGGRGDSMLLVIPAYNEQGGIASVVRNAREALPDTDVLVIDDGSADATADEARRAGAYVVRLPFNLGIGGAVQTGLKFARRHAYPVVLRIDGDGQHDPRLLGRLLERIRAGEADVAVGSRFLAQAPTMAIPLLRRLGIRLFAKEVSLLTGRQTSDTTSGMLAMNQRAVDLLATYMPQDYPEVESRIILHDAGLKTVEVPVEMRERTTGTSSITAWRSIYYAVKVLVAVLLTSLKHTPRLEPLAGGDRPST